MLKSRPQIPPSSRSSIGIKTASTAPGVVVELQTNKCPFLPAAFMALATGCMAFNKNSLEKLPSGKLGEGGMKKVASVVTVSLASDVARNRERPALMVSASRRSEERRVGKEC